MLVVGVFISFNQAVVSKPIIKRIGEYQTMRLGLLLSIIGLISITLTDILWLYIILYYTLNLGISLCLPTFNALTAKNAKSQEMGEVMGISDSIISMNNAIIPVIAAGLYGLICANIYYVAAILPKIVLYFAWNFKPPSQQANSTSNDNKWPAEVLTK